ncbi:hypothetical protein JCM9533A_62750 [Catenuloplanes niger JCM 9533]
MIAAAHAVQAGSLAAASADVSPVRSAWSSVPKKYGTNSFAPSLLRSDTAPLGSGAEFDAVTLSAGGCGAASGPPPPPVV